jgi:hypothetical protein
MGKHRFTKAEEFAIWKHHGPWCFWCEEPLRWIEVTIDHYIPEYLENYPAELDEVRAQYGLPSNFVVNDYCNWLPCHAHCNRNKGPELPIPIHVAASILRSLAKHAEKIRSIEQKIKNDVKKDRLIGQVAVALEANKLARDEVRALLAQPAIQQDEDIELLRRETYLDVDQHYVDFLNRKPDPNSLVFWTTQIADGLGSSSPDNTDVLIKISSAFFLSTEFYDSGYLVYRMYKAAFGSNTGTSNVGGIHRISVPIVRLSEFVPAIQQIGQSVIEGKGDWQTQLESNKRKFMSDFVLRSRFVLAYPTSMTPAQFIDTLYLNAGVTPSTAERNSAIGEFGSANSTVDTSARARSLRLVAENSTLAQQEFNKAFVLMQYFGYLRRDPDGAPDTDFSGYDFWLRKLNQFRGNYVDAEMVKAFITSEEYRKRFGS